jgi:glucosamine--fructose-6-phosphate aminotransferase (isomerizing)
MASEHYFIQYVHENPAAVRRTLEENEQAVLSLAGRVRSAGIQRVIVTGIGSSYTAAKMAEPMFRIHSQLPVHILPATSLDFYASRLVDRDTLVIVVSRSGERNWVVEALKESIRRGAMGVAMTGVADSLLAQNAQWTLVTGEGPELSFPKTKSVMTCAALLMRIALALAAPTDTAAQARLAELRAIPDAIRQTIAATEPEIKAQMPFIASHANLYVCGTGSNYGAALEAAVKVQEAAYVTTLCDDTGNTLHGPVSPFDPTWLLAPLISAHDLQLSKELLQLANQLGAHNLAIVEPGLDLEALSDHLIRLPRRVDPLVSALVFLVPIQLLTYYWTLSCGRNPDLPEAARAILEAILPPGREEPGLS